MNTIKPHGSNEVPSTIELIERDPNLKERREILRWWYRFAAPAEVPASATLQQREAFRRGRLISVILLILICILTTVALTVGIFVNPALFPNLSVVILILFGAVLLNRHGYVIIAGTLVVVVLDFSVIIDFLSYPHGLSVFLLPLFDIFVLPELLAVSLLPPRAVFVDALLHIAFIVASLAFGLLPHSPDLRAVLQSPDLADALARPIAIQVLVAVVSYLWVSSANAAIARADRATVIATLEHSLAEQAQADVEQKRLLDASIQQIVQVHARVSNGDFSARVPLTSDNVLWQVAGSLNNLLARLQRSRENEQNLDRFVRVADYYREAMRKAQGGVIQWPKEGTGTPLDAIVYEHNMRVQGSILREGSSMPTRYKRDDLKSS